VVFGESAGVKPDADWNKGKDYACSRCQRVYWSDAVYSDEALGWHIDNGEYQMTECLDSDIFVIKSPYFTFAPFCSPCVPGAGDLDGAGKDRRGVKCFALGHYWFEDGSAPYPVYSVATGELVAPDGATGTVEPSEAVSGFDFQEPTT